MSRPSPTTSLSTPPDEGSVGAAPLWNIGVKALLVLIVIVGLAARAMPLLDGTDREFLQYPTEDGYLTLTIARDIADGLGMTTAEGTIPTNGTQPLCTMLWAGVFWMHGTEGTEAFRTIQLIQILFASLSAWLLYRLGRLVLASNRNGQLIAATAAALWFAAPHGIAKTQNCLETGAYTLLALAFVHLLVRQHGRPEFRDRLGTAVGVGVWLGLAFWTRNDGVFLSAGFCLAWLCLDRDGKPRMPFTHPGSRQALVAGSVALLISVPWLYLNYTRFGSIMPISGQAQASGVLGSKATAMPASLLELATVILPGSYTLDLLPHKVEQAGVGLLLALYTWFLFRLRGSVNLPRRVTVVLVFFTGSLALYYSLTSFANWHYGRYLFPTSTFFALASVAMLFGALGRLPAGARQGLVLLLLTGSLAVVAYRNAAVYEKGTSTTRTHYHFAEWVEDEGLKDDWIGAPESGVLGYFYPRTMNLDGKVNPDAMRARRSGNYADYLLDSPITYIVGQVSFVESELAQDSRIAAAFEWVERDEDLNVGVVKRVNTGL